jgi:L-malate glycosyltransferase
MKIGIYREFSGEWATLGGAEFCVAALAEGLEEQHDVEIIHDIPALTRESVAEFFGIRLRRTRFRFERGSPLMKPAVLDRSRRPWRMYRQAARWNSHLSAPYDLFICFTHFLPPFCHAGDGLLIVLFPFLDRSRYWPWSEGPGGRRPRMLRAARNAVYDWVWDERFRSYRHRFAISEFTRRWTKRWWDIDCGVLYPPVDLRARGGAKQPVILSVGRFHPTKKQLELVRAFAALTRAGSGGWSYHCAGGLTDRADERAFYDELRCAAGSAPIRFTANPSRAELESSMGSAGIFWHAKGYGEDEEARPAAMEHFGIVTVEAMAWGCVPVVVNRGGQPEIVRHGVDGFLWDTLGELEHYTRLLMRDDALRAAMSASARQRAQAFGKQRFVREVADRCGLPLIGRQAPSDIDVTIHQ